MRTLTRFWPSLECVVGTSAVVPQWRMLLGAEHNRVSHFFRSQDKFALSCRHTDSEGFPYRVMIDGDKIVAIDVSGNFDEAHFTNASQFNHDRFVGASERQYAPAGDILTFGKGTHHCVGSRLGQLEMMHGFTQLLDRVGRIDPAGELPQGVGFFLHSPPSLPVVLHPAQ